VSSVYYQRVFASGLRNLKELQHFDVAVALKLCLDNKDNLVHDIVCAAKEVIVLSMRELQPEKGESKDDTRTATTRTKHETMTQQRAEGTPTASCGSTTSTSNQIDHRGEGNNVGRMRWHEQWMEGGTTIERFHGFIDRVLENLDQNHPGRSFVFTMDNLSAHRNPLVTNRILNAGDRYVFRASYWPVDGAVEYVFNALQSKLRIYFNRLETMDDLRNRINLTVGGI